MALDKNIRGITIEINGETSGLDKALKKVDGTTKSMQSELKQVNGLLKFDPKNVELLSQKQKILTDAIGNTSTKLDALKQAQAEVERQFQSGEIGEQAYRKFQRELIATEGQLKSFKAQADAVKIKLDAQVDTSGLDKMKQKLEEVSQTAKEVGQKMKDVGSDMSTKVTAPIVAFGTGALLAAGQFDNAVGQIQASLGVTANEAEKLENIATNVWKNGFGESLEEVSGALIRVKQNMKGITDDAEIEKVTQDALALAKAFDSDVNEVTRAGNNLMVNFGIESKEAFDLMAYGAQNGLNFSNEMFDNIAEYSGLFSTLGFEADEYFNLLMKGSQSGIYNLDYLNDVIKEFGIRIKDNSTGTADAIAELFQPEGFEEFIGNLATSGTKAQEFGQLVEAVGKESANEMVKGLQKGGKTAEDTILAMQKTMGGYADIMDGISDGTLKGSEAFDTILRKIQEIPDASKRAELGVQLMGTKWEDLEEKAMFSLIGVNGELEGLENNMAKVTEAQEQTFGQRWDTLTRSTIASLEPLGKILLDFAEQFIPKIIAMVETLATWFSNLSPIIQNLIVVFGAIVASIGPLLLILGAVIASVGQIIPVVLKAIDIFKNFGVVTGALTSPIGLAVVAIVGIVTALVLAYQKVEWFRDGVNNIFGKIKDLTMTIFTSVKNTITSLISSAVEFGSSLLSKFKSFWDENGKAISDIVKLYFGIIKTNIESVMGIIKGIFEVVWPLISGIVKVAFELIQLAIKNALDIALGVISAFVKILTGDWRGAWDEVKKIVENIWDNILTFLRKIDLMQIGKDIVQGLINGITSMAKSLWDSVTSLIDGIGETAMRILGIKSPSKQFRQIGLWTGEGLAIGIEESEGTVRNATLSMVDGITKATKDFQDEYKSLQTAFDKDRTSKNEQVLAKIQKIEQTAAKKKRALTKDEQAQIAKLEKEHRDNKLKSEQEFNKKYLTLVQKSEKEYLAIMTQSLEEQKANYEMTSYEEARYWANLIEMFSEGSSERLKVTQNYNKAIDELNKELEQIEQDHVSQIKAINEQLTQDIENETKKYTDALDARMTKLSGFASLFDEFTVDMSVSGQTLKDNLQSQVDAFNLWETTITKLIGRGVISKELEEELNDMGVSALPQLIALNSMTDQQLKEYSDLFDTRSKQARERAEQELIGMKFDTAVRIEELKLEANKKLDEVNKSWDEQIKKLTTATRTELGQLRQIGVDAGTGLLNGLSSMEGALIAKAQSIASAISATIASALQISSPSKVMEGFGINIAEGLIVGMDDMISKVSQSSKRLSNAVSGVYGSLSNSASQSKTMSSVSNTTSTIHNTPTSNTFNITIDAKNVKEFNDIIKLIQGIPQVSRAF